MIQADKHLREYLQRYSVRDMLIGEISDTYKEAYGFRPRWNWSAMTLLQLWQESRQLYVDAARERDERDELDALYAAMEAEDARIEAVMPTWEDDMADRLAGVR